MPYRFVADVDADFMLSSRIFCLKKYRWYTYILPALLVTKGRVTLVTITGTTILVPYLKVPATTIWKLGICRWSLQRLDYITGHQVNVPGSNSKLNKILWCSCSYRIQLITMKFCTRHDSNAVVTCENFVVISWAHFKPEHANFDRILNLTKIP